ncbi:MAG: redoxin domain-containing protein [Gammaproteobacteria bacterium]|nr:redoxin domain-containing protein [Gammaproteobacteria bacterium]NKB64377.1 redoxin domain-containing protein [Gammaproteobacteria bacterium]
MKTIVRIIVLLSWILNSSLISSAWGSSLVGLHAYHLDDTSQTLDVEISKKATIILMLGKECPVSKRFIPRLNELYSVANSLDFNFYGLFPNPWDNAENIRQFQQEYDIHFPLLIDRHATVAKKLKPVASPESFVFDKQGTLVYRGRIDNRFASIGVLRTNISRHELADAMEAVFNDSMPAVPYTEPVGCFYGKWDTDTAETSHDHGIHSRTHDGTYSHRESD